MRKLIYICIVLFLHSCSFVPKEIINNYNFCYNNEKTEIENKLNINGLFYGNIVHTTHTTGISIFFFNDGTCVFLPGKLPKSYFTDISYNGEIFKNNIDKAFTCYWGSYIIVEDTIKTQIIEHHGFWDSWMASEEWYVIIDKSTITRIYSNSLRQTNTYDISQIKNNGLYKPMTVIPIVREVEFYNWLKDKKWFWCNEEDYEAYMKQKNK